MPYVFVEPSWFFIYSIILEAFFAVITLVVSYYAFKVYKLIEEDNAKLLSNAFLCIAISYIVQAVLNIIVLSKFDEDVVSLMSLRDAALLNLFGTYVHALFFVIGLVLLTYTTFKVRNIRIVTLLISIILVAVLFCPNKVFLFYVIAAILLIHTVIHYFINYLKSKKINALLILTAMILLFIASLQFILAVNYEIYYVLGHILEFVAYALILTNLVIILKNDKKKR